MRLKLFGRGSDLTAGVRSNSKICRACRWCLVSFLDSQNVNLKGLHVRGPQSRVEFRKKGGIVSPERPNRFDFTYECAAPYKLIV